MFKNYVKLKFQWSFVVHSQLITKEVIGSNVVYTYIIRTMFTFDQTKNIIYKLLTALSFII